MEGWLAGVEEPFTPLSRVSGGRVEGLGCTQDCRVFGAETIQRMLIIWAQNVV